MILNRLVFFLTQFEIIEQLQKIIPQRPSEKSNPVQIEMLLFIYFKDLFQRLRIVNKAEEVGLKGW